MVRASVARRRGLKTQEKLEKQAEEARGVCRSRRSRRPFLMLVSVALSPGAAFAGAWSLGLLSRAPAARSPQLPPVPAHLAPLRYGARAEPRYYRSWRNSTVSIRGPTAAWHGVQSLGQVTVPSTGRPGSFVVVRGLLLREEADSALAGARSSPGAGWSGRGDTPFMLQGSALQDPSHPSGLDAVAAAMMPMVEERLVPYARRQYGCPWCVVCRASVNRYLPGQQRVLARHYDWAAYLSAVVPLNAADEYLGGFFVQTAANAHSREFLELQAGDMVLHQYDLEHAVDVLNGSRYSAVFWFSDSPGACKQNTRPWYEAAANRGDSVAQFNLGHILARAQPATALMWMRRSAEQGYLAAMLSLGSWHMEGYGRIAKNATLSAEWMMRAAWQDDAVAQFYVGLLHHQGMAGMARDERLAAEWYWRAAEQGYERAQHNLGHLHRYGSRSWRRNATTAVAWFQHAAEQGWPEAQFELAVCYLSGEGVPRDVDAAMEWLREAAERGQPTAQRELGKHYLAGEGMPLDYAKAAGWISKAAKLGETDAQMILGKFFALGIGVPRSRAKARTWFRKSAQNGDRARVVAHLQAMEADNPGGWPGLLSEKDNAGDVVELDAGRIGKEPLPDGEKEDTLFDGVASPFED